MYDFFGIRNSLLPKSVGQHFSHKIKKIGRRMPPTQIPSAPRRGRHGKDLSNEKRLKLINLLRGKVVDGELPYGSMSAVARTLKVCPSSVSRLWKLVRAREKNGGRGSPAVLRQMPARASRRVYPRDLMRECLAALPPSAPRTQRALAAHLGVSQGTVNRMLREEDSPLKAAPAAVARIPAPGGRTDGASRVVEKSRVRRGKPPRVCRSPARTATPRARGAACQRSKP